MCLDMYPDAVTREWLLPELKKAGADKPLILFFHYPVLPGNQGWSRAWPDEDKEAFGQALDGHNVIAIFHGHMHAPGHYVWRDRPIFRPGAAKSRQRFFLVVRVGAEEMSVATWNFETPGWGETWSVPIRRAAPTAGRGRLPLALSARRQHRELDQRFLDPSAAARGRSRSCR
jgi:hypothetical protein